MIDLILDMAGPAGMSRRDFTRLLMLAVPAIGSGACAVRAQRQSSLPDFVALVERAAPSVVAVGEAKQTLGSGFAVAADLVVTAAHVAQAVKQLVVTSPGGAQPARVLGARTDDDVALLEVGTPLKPLPLAAALPRVGEWIVVVGNPFGGGMTATAGIVSAAPGAIAANPELARRIQINASVNPGNSGGPVINLAGEVVGATTSLVAGGQGIAFATSAAVIRAFLATRGK
jgi:S1-C subfamily serine protease